MVKHEVIIGPCSEFIEGKGWTTKVPVDKLEELGYTKLSKESNQYVPGMGKTVYCIYDDSCIITNEVGYLGKEGFIIENFTDSLCFDSLLWLYKDYNRIWFTDLSEAKKKLLEVVPKEPGEKLKVVKISETYYEVREV